MKQPVSMDALGCPTVSLTGSSPNWAMPAFLPLGICEQRVAGSCKGLRKTRSPLTLTEGI